jgi:hypothetical protein
VTVLAASHGSLLPLVDVDGAIVVRVECLEGARDLLLGLEDAHLLEAFFKLSLSDVPIAVLIELPEDFLCLMLGFEVIMGLQLSRDVTLHYPLNLLRFLNISFNVANDLP